MDKFINLINTTSVVFQSVEISKAFLVFIFFSFIGWISEVLYVGIFFEHKFVNRGFLHGPLCPIYGIGGILVLSLPEKLQNPVWVLFITGTVFTSIVEYAGSFALEKIFHTKWWDYSSKKIKIKGKVIRLNVNGRICLQNSLLFGFLTVVVLKLVQPLIENLFDLFSDFVLQAVSDVILVVFAIDLIVTIHRLVDFHSYIIRLKELEEDLIDRFGHESWFKASSLLEMIESVKFKAGYKKDKISAILLEKLEKATACHKNAESFIRKFPTMKSSVYKAPVLMLKRRVKKMKKSKKI